MRRRPRPPLAASALAALALLAAAAPLLRAEEVDPLPRPVRGRSPEYKQALQAIEAIAKKKPASRSTGSVGDGAIESSAELPAKGFGYRFASPARKTHFGSDAMTYSLMELAALWQERNPRAPAFSIGDISSEKGGKLSPHINHQDGNDVDFAFLYCTEKGEPVDRGWLACDETGKTKSGVRFDVARNFELLELWYESPFTGGFEWVLIYDPLKKLLVEHGRALEKQRPREAERIRLTTNALEKALRQPSSSPHADHFHARVLPRQKRPRGSEYMALPRGFVPPKKAAPKKSEPKKPPPKKDPPGKDDPKKGEPEEGEGERKEPGGGGEDGEGMRPEPPAPEEPDAPERPEPPDDGGDDGDEDDEDEDG
jgi:hypothetical protein